MSDFPSFLRHHDLSPAFINPTSPSSLPSTVSNPQFSEEDEKITSQVESMAQREEKKTELHAPESLALCANNCGFPGSPATNNMCQSCFHQASSPAPPRCCSPGSAPHIPSKGAEEDGAAKAAEARASAAAAPQVRKVNRCLVCRKRVGLTGFRCRCGDLFCGEHRYSDRHDCSFDYKAAARAAIARANPVVRAAKVVRV